MKFLILSILLSCQLSLSTTLPTVSNVDLNKYQGRWYEIARFDQKFQKGCTAVTADYKILKSNKISVVNRCRLNTIDGKLKSAKGKAWVVDKKTNSKLRVQFFLSFLKLNFLAGDYWIIDLDENYEHVMVGAPNREYLWIMSRRPFLNEDIFKELKDKATNLGFDISKLMITKH